MRGDVAITILPEVSAADPERLARFEREAQALAALNHSDIAQIYGIEESDDVRALVIKLVDVTRCTTASRSGRFPWMRRCRLPD